MAFVFGDERADTRASGQRVPKCATVPKKPKKPNQGVPKRATVPKNQKKQSFQPLRGPVFSKFVCFWFFWYTYSISVQNIGFCCKCTKKHKYMQISQKRDLSMAENFVFFGFLVHLQQNQYYELFFFVFLVHLQHFAFLHRKPERVPKKQAPWLNTTQSESALGCLRANHNSIKHGSESALGCLRSISIEISNIQKWTVFCLVLENCEWFKTEIEKSERFEKVPLAAYLIYIYIFNQGPIS